MCFITHWVQWYAKWPFHSHKNKLQLCVKKRWLLTVMYMWSPSQNLCDNNFFLFSFFFVQLPAVFLQGDDCWSQVCTHFHHSFCKVVRSWNGSGYGGGGGRGCFGCSSTPPSSQDNLQISQWILGWIAGFSTPFCPESFIWHEFDYKFG